MGPPAAIVFGRGGHVVLIRAKRRSVTLVISIGRTMRLFAIFSGKRNEIPLRRYLRIAQPKGGNSSWRYAPTLFALLLLQASLLTVHAQNSAPVTLSGPELRVEA